MTKRSDSNAAFAAHAKRILVVHPAVRPPGGSNGVAAWVLEALHRDHEVTLLTLEPFSAGALNRFYGTNIDEKRVEVLIQRPFLMEQLSRVPLRLSLLRHSLLLHNLERYVRGFDLVIHTENEANLFRRGIQYVHFPAYFRPRPDAERPVLHHRWLLRAYYGLCDRLARNSREAIKRNLTLVNSDWTGRAMSETYDQHPTITLYPPVAGDFPQVPWEEREPHFVCIGRISSEKRVERVIGILKRVRARFPEIRLHLVGTSDDDVYGRRIRAAVEEERAWIELHQDISRGELLELISHQRFGIHGMPEEHFGMAVAELVRAGCVVWVPDGGGQVEIVRKNPHLCYQSDDQAVAEICRALEDPAHALALRAMLEPQRERYTEQQFMLRLRQIVEQFFEGERAVVRDTT